MPLVYAAVARSTIIVAEYAAANGNFNNILSGLLTKIQNNDGRCSMTVDKYLFSFVNTNGYIYAVVGDESIARSIPFAFLEKLQNEFVAKYNDKGRNAAANSLSNQFGKKMKELVDTCNSNPEEYSKLSSVQKKVWLEKEAPPVVVTHKVVPSQPVDEVKNIMTDNIEKVLARGEKLELLVDKTDNLMYEADRFQRTGRSLRRKMWWQNCKMKLVVALVVILAAFIIFILVCFSGGNCITAGKNKAKAAQQKVNEYKARYSASPSPVPSPFLRTNTTGTFSAGAD